MSQIANKNFDKAVFSGAAYDACKEFWANKYAEIDEPFIFSLRKQRPAIKSAPKFSSIERALSIAATTVINKMANDDNSRFVIVLAAVNYVLGRYCSRDTVILKTPLLKKGAVEDIFTSEVFLFQNLNIKGTAKEFILLVKENVIKSYAFQNFPLQLLHIPADHLSNCMMYSGAIHLVPGDQEYDLLIEVKNESIVINYDESLFTKAFIEKFLTHIDNVLHSFSNLNKPLEAIEYLKEEEKEKLLVTFNSTVKENTPTTIIEAFQQQVMTTPEHTAIIYKEQALSYRELNERVNALAYYIKNESGIAPKSLIGLMIKRSERMIIALLAILKAGCAYVPIDPKTPAERIKYMLNDTGCELLFIDSENMMELGDYEKQVFVLDLQLDTLDKPAEETHYTVNENDLAYIIYTSGTTGTPKGVPISHGNIINTLLWRVGYYSFGTGSVNLQLPSYSFDSSVEDIFSVLIAGGRLVIPEEESRTDPFYLEKLILTNKVTHFLITPSFYQVLLTNIRESLYGLTAVTVAGEQVSEGLVKEHYALLPAVKLINEYGPTENAVCSTAGEMRPDASPVTIGKPIWNVKAYILDHHGSLLPENVPGELYLAGKGVAHGYWNKETITAEKFVVNPYAPAEKMYRTGDLCKWLPDGSIEFLGRVDHQIKIRGYRVEPGEVAAILKQYPQVKDALVIARDNIRLEKEMVAYLLVNAAVQADELRAHIAKYLPDFMAPAHFVVLEKFPLNINQKINYQVLPAPEGLSLESKIEFVAPATLLEEELAAVWGEILKTTKIGVHDNFFAVGGNSIRLIELYGQLSKKYQGVFEITDLFSNPTIHAQAALVQQKDKKYQVSETVIIDF